MSPSFSALLCPLIVFPPHSTRTIDQIVSLFCSEPHTGSPCCSVQKLKPSHGHEFLHNLHPHISLWHHLPFFSFSHTGLLALYQICQDTPTSGPLHLLFLLPGMLFPDTHMIAPSPPSDLSSNFTFSLRASLTILFKMEPMPSYFEFLFPALFFP